MLDTYGRKYVDPLINHVANFFLEKKKQPNEITILALVVGLTTGPLIYLDHPILATVFLWISGLLDAVDGAMARKIEKTSPWGTLMDITFDRMVEITVFLSLGLKYPKARMELLILMVAILLSMTIFLTVGALSDQRGIKSFYYQAGLAERTEGFLLSSLMILLSRYAGLVFFTAVQRMLEAKRILSHLE